MDVPVGQATCDLIPCNIPEDVSLRGTDDFAARMGIGAGCGGGTIKDVEANAAVDCLVHFWGSRRCGLSEGLSLTGADDSSTGVLARASYSIISHIPLLLGIDLHLDSTEESAHQILR